MAAPNYYVVGSSNGWTTEIAADLDTYTEAIVYGDDVWFVQETPTGGQSVDDTTAQTGLGASIPAGTTSLLVVEMDGAYDPADPTKVIRELKRAIALTRAEYPSNPIGLRGWTPCAWPGRTITWNGFSDMDPRTVAYQVHYQFVAPDRDYIRRWDAIIELSNYCASELSPLVDYLCPDFTHLSSDITNCMKHVHRYLDYYWQYWHDVPCLPWISNIRQPANVTTVTACAQRTGTIMGSALEAGWIDGVVFADEDTTVDGTWLDYHKAELTG